MVRSGRNDYRLAGLRAHPLDAGYTTVANTQVSTQQYGPVADDPSWLSVYDERANAASAVRFARVDWTTCAGCEHCTYGISGRQLTLDAEERYTLLARPRAAAD